LYIELKFKNSKWIFSWRYRVFRISERNSVSLYHWTLLIKLSKSANLNFAPRKLTQQHFVQGNGVALPCSDRGRYEAGPRTAAVWADLGSISGKCESSKGIAKSAANWQLWACPRPPESRRLCSPPAGNSGPSEVPTGTTASGRNVCWWL